MSPLDLNHAAGLASPSSPPDTDPLFAGRSELAWLMRAFDWRSTPLGPPGQWPQELRTAVRIMLTSQQPIWIGWGPELTYLYNDPYKSIIGGRHPAALGQPTAVVWREIWEHIGPMLAQAMGGLEGTYVEEQLLIMERNGYPEETYYTFSYSPIPAGDGTAGGIFCANTEDTQRVIGERQLALLRELAASTAEARSWQQACERSVHALATNSRDLPFALIYVLDRQSPTAWLAGLTGIDPHHPAAVATLSLERDDVWPLSQAMREHRALRVSDLAAAFGAPFPGGAWHLPATDAVVVPVPASGETGRSVVLVAGLSPVRLFDDRYAGFLDLVARQIAAAIANAEAYEQERRRAEALAQVDRAKTAFFSNVSHEFRTPLTLMLGPLEEVMAKGEGQGFAENRGLVSVAHRNGVRLLKLVNTLLDFSRIEAGKARAQFEPVDLAALTAELAEMFRAPVERAGLRMRIDCLPLAEPVYADRDMWEKIVLNLLSNAFKFTFAGEIAVEVRPGPDGRTASLSVRDTGTGVPAEELPHLFERFHRVAGARGRSIEGSGIGLALVQELVALHGGTIVADSAPGRGSAFTITLPFGTAHLAPDRIRAPAGGGVSSVRAQAYLQEAASWLAPDVAAADVPTASGPADLDLPAVAAASDQGRRILLADDNLDMRNYVERLLRAAGYRVRAVADGDAALAVASTEKPDLVLSDVMMPKLDGFGLLARVRADDALRDTPVILLSARAGEDAKVEGLRSGADDYLVKPFSARELLARVEANIRLAHSREESSRLLREEAYILELLNRVGTAVAAEVDLERTVQVVTDAATELSGAALGSFFHKVVDERGEAYTLYTLSGAPREAFAGFPMPHNSEVISSTFRGEGIVRSPDITQDPRFGKTPSCSGARDGNPPIRSYLAVPVVSRAGEVMGGLFFGHPQVGVFDATAERIVSAIAVQAAIAIDKARLHRSAQEEIARRKGIEEALRESEQSLEHKVAERTAELAAANARLRQEGSEREKVEGRFQHMVEGVVDYALFMLSPEGIISNWNTGAERIKGYSAADIVGQHFERFYTEEDRAAGVPVRALETATREGKFEAEGWRVRKDGTRFWASVVINPIRDRSGDLLGFTKITRDMTERRKAQQDLMRTQEQLAQSQKMEGIGQLTGGVAHDFNNLLTIIIGNLETIQRQLGNGNADSARLARSADLAMRGARRAEALTQRMLAFSRQQPLDPRSVDIGRLVTSTSDLLRRTLGETVTVETVLAGGVWRTFVDPNQLEVALINLAVNARDAMPQGGKLTIETANVYLDDRYAAGEAEVLPGQYVMLAVSDTGTGMTHEVLTRAFEPFFTTKDVGHGTGLGLSQVYGFVKQSGGHAKIYSEVGEGTTVKLYLPRLHAEGAAETEEAPATMAGSAGTETILVVEDDADVRSYTSETLRELGYSVVEATNGATALRALDDNPDIDLVFTDIGLPGGMNGRKLADAVREKRQGLKVLFTTGYARNAIVHDGRLDPGVDLITKPFTQAALAARLRDILDARAHPARILVVEDEVLLQMLAIDILSEAGFKVEAVGSATDAINKTRRIPGGVDAAVIDIGLPDRRGDMLVRELRAIYPSLPIVIASGRASVDLGGWLQDEGTIAFVEKPYTSTDLLGALRSVGIRHTVARP